jgi:serine/threonine protein kinase
MNIPRQFSHPVPIGHGSFSTVYRVWQQKLERHAVVKIIPFKVAADAARIEKEAYILASTRLPCVPHIYDVIRTGKKVIIVMEWVRGIPLLSLLERPVSLEISIAIASAIISSLTLLHSSNLVHGDLKPENILIAPEGRIFFVDFGFSFKERRSSPDSGVIQGTPPYMAPELWSCQDVIDHKKADLFALGVVLQNLLGNDLPAFATELTASDPACRPQSCALFEKAWQEFFSPLAGSEKLRIAVGPVVEEYIARLLLVGARQLHGKGKKEEAYALLTESLDSWPDNPEALDYLQNKFSTPIQASGVKKTASTGLMALAATLALIAAYMLGTRSSSSHDFFYRQQPGIEAEGRHLSLLSAPKNAHRTTAIPTALRDLPAGMEVNGTLIIVTPNRIGKLFIDKVPVSFGAGEPFTAILPAGGHRVEWIDSTMHRTYGETIGLLPFEKKTISFLRFANGS